MRLIDADALPRCACPQHGCNGGFAFVDARDIDAAPTITCQTCRHAIDSEPNVAYLCDVGNGWQAAWYGCAKWEARP